MQSHFAPTRVGSQCVHPYRLKDATALAELEHEVHGVFGRGADLVGLPENFAFMGDDEQRLEQAASLAERAQRFLVTMARRYQVTLLGGGYPVPAGERLTSNRAELVGKDGQILATYDKIHLFDVDVPGAVHRESATITAGADVVVTDVGDVRIGQATCYDLRFPELFRALLDRGAHAVVLPSAFTAATGKDHWEPLIRARAIENQVYVIAPNQRASSNDRLHWHGRSMIVDPWGVVVAQAPDRDCVITAEIDLDAQRAIRAKLPSGDHRRPELF